MKTTFGKSVDYYAGDKPNLAYLLDQSADEAEKMNLFFNGREAAPVFHELADYLREIYKKEQNEREFNK